MRSLALQAVMEGNVPLAGIDFHQSGKA